MIDEEQNTMTDHSNLLNLTSGIVSAYVSENPVPPLQLPDLITSTFAALACCGVAEAAKDANADRPARAFTGSVKASIKPDGIISMIDGKPYKMLKRHIGLHGYTAESYRTAFDLPADYPMVAPEYAAVRRAIAIKIGLGRKREGA